MSTKTVRLRSNKRKEIDDFDTVKSSQPAATKLHKPTVSQAGSGMLSEPIASNQLLAGYLAFEYLTKGTLCGQPFDPCQAEAVPGEVKPGVKDEEAQPNKENYTRYVEVSNLLKADGAQLAGVINPSQLARFFHV
ncbi:conserved hypothetical protein [Ricinus communis]|uniref:Uncharacterized protein n=1 Tax=Ricinus communis TaxID=3988 RepID=B9SV15_RICCO|nr:conserved hypothetical protein [Ricinus communis]|eukprot:XP_015581243.1 uncharacterized protein LOC8279692 [Ricinus communis]